MHNVYWVNVGLGDSREDEEDEEEDEEDEEDEEEKKEKKGVVLGLELGLVLPARGVGTLG